jgi:hypothetical protein
MAGNERNVILLAQDHPVPDSLGKVNEDFCSIQNKTSSSAERIITSRRALFLTVFQITFRR